MKKKKLLEELWYAYEMTRPVKWSEEAKRLLDEMDNLEETLFADLTEDQKDALANFRASVNELNGVLVKEAYQKGVRFATAYLLEAFAKSEDA